jgi:hypothetical protein
MSCTEASSKLVVKVEADILTPGHTYVIQVNFDPDDEILGRYLMGDPDED